MILKKKIKRTKAGWKRGLICILLAAAALSISACGTEQAEAGTLSRDTDSASLESGDKTEENRSESEAGTENVIMPEEDTAVPAEETGKEVLPAEETEAEAGTPEAAEAEEIAPEDVIEPNAGKQVIYLILATEEGASAVEKDILSSNLSEAGYDVILRCHNYDEEAQNGAFDEAIAVGAGAIVCDNMPGDETQEAVQRAADAGVAVCLLHEGIDRSGVAMAQILTDKASCVGNLADTVMNELQDVRFISLSGAKTDSRAVDAMTLLTDAMKKKKALCYAAVTPDTYDETKETVLELLSSYPETNLLLCYNVEQTKAALEAMEGLGLKGVKVVCLNGDRDEIEALVRGGQVEAAVAKPAEELAQTAADMIVRYFKNGTSSINERQYIKGKILTAEG